MKKLLVTVGCAFGVLSAAYAQYHMWSLVGKSDKIIFEFQKGSGRFNKTRGGEPIYVANGRTTEIETSEIKYNMIFIRYADCANGYGKIVTTDMTGNFYFDNDFNLASNRTIADTAASILCASAQMTTKKIQENSI